ncbi:MAG TPA: VOC family protein [Gammaproteobacteria bacterium]|nr:VOC family protein [Gammaproteobacteria bacterium]
MNDNRGPVRRVLALSRTVSDLDRAVAFYREALDFSLLGRERREQSAWAELLGLPRVRGEVARLGLGEEKLELVACEPAGRAYPPESGVADHWFQHVAIVVSDMAAACERLDARPFEAISENGPQQLPANTGSVTAYKFRDPDGHPLELLHFPTGSGDPGWQRKPGLFLGLDHSAITVADLNESLDFYTRLLGFTIAGRSLNSGPAQANLDHAANVHVRVVALQPANAAGAPHLELLCYERPAGQAMLPDTKPDDVFADRLLLEVSDLPALVRVLEAEAVSFLSPGMVRLANGERAALVRDPTGHLLLLSESAGAAQAR